MAENRLFISTLIRLSIRDFLTKFASKAKASENQGCVKTGAQKGS